MENLRAFCPGFFAEVGHYIIEIVIEGLDEMLVFWNGTS